MSYGYLHSLNDGLLWECLRKIALITQNQQRNVLQDIAVINHNTKQLLFFQKGNVSQLRQATLSDGLPMSS